MHRGAPLEVLNQYGGTVLGSALWSAVNAKRKVDYLPVIETLIDGGATIDPAWTTGIERIDSVLRTPRTHP